MIRGHGLAAGALALLLLAGAHRSTAAPPGPEQEAALFEAGSAALDGGALAEAALKFEALLKDMTEQGQVGPPVPAPDKYLDRTYWEEARRSLE